MGVGKVSDADFEAQVLKATEPVVVDFWAEWCGPCKMIAPALEEIAGSLDGKVKIVKLNVDDQNAQAGSVDRTDGAEVDYNARLVLGHRHSAQRIGVIAADDSPRTAQHRDIRRLLNYQLQHATLHAVCRLAHENEYVITERTVPKEIQLVV